MQKHQYTNLQLVAEWPHRNKTTTSQGDKAMNMSIHNVTDVRIEETRDIKSFCTRTLVIRDAKGNQYEITLFADDAEKLEVRL